MNFRLILILLLLMLSVIPVHAVDLSNETENETNFSINTIGNYPLIPPAEPNKTAPIPYEEGNTISEAPNFDPSDAGSDMVAVGMWDKGPTIAANAIYDTFGKTRGFIFSFINYNINPENIPLAKDYNDKNQNIAVILAVLFMFGEGLSSSLAGANYPAYKNVFGEKEFSQKKYVGGGVAMIAGLGAAWVFRGVMIFIDLIDAYLMLSIMDSIKPSVDNGLMYFAMAVIELSLLGFFLYRQILIGAMFIASPIYGVMWASGYAKELIDSIGDKFIRALIMQPLCIFLTVVAISIMKSIEWEIFGIVVWDADNELTLYAILLVFLLLTCIWCIFGKMTIVKRTINMAVFKKVR